MTNIYDPAEEFNKALAAYHAAVAADLMKASDHEARAQMSIPEVNESDGKFIDAVHEARENLLRTRACHAWQLQAKFEIFASAFFDADEQPALHGRAFLAYLLEDVLLAWDRRPRFAADHQIAA